MPLLMALTIAGIAGFQYYWLKKAYQRERRTLEMRSNITFRETVFLLQAARLRLDKLPVDSSGKGGVFVSDSGSSRIIIRSIDDKPLRMRVRDDARMMRMVQVLNERLARQKKNDSLRGERTILLAETNVPDSLGPDRHRRFRQRDRLLQLLYEAESPQDSLRLADIRGALEKRLRQQNIPIPFQVLRLAGGRRDDEEFNKVSIGFRSPVTYQLVLENTFPYLLQRIQAPIIMSLFLVLFTLVTFWVLYRNLLRQQRLAAIKNEFISNITHELKTPIATVSVAIEAMRSFNAGMDPERSREYLDISANELQRLSLLVDKVLKLSMFEKKEIELRVEALDLRELAGEVTSSMRLQFERRQAIVHTEAEGDTTLRGDRLNLVSVIFNLVDNALKYSEGNPQIRISVLDAQDHVTLSVEDQGIGVPQEYRKRIFEKFFRVPHGNVHNAKGYGLGLSYVAHVVERHRGSIRVEPNQPQGSRFVITLPKNLS